MMKVSTVALRLFLFTAIFSLMFGVTCFAETSYESAPQRPSDFFELGPNDFRSYGNSGAILIEKANSAELIEVDIFGGCFKSYKFEEKIDVIHFGGLYFTYTDSEGNGWLWLFNGNNNPLPFNESDYEDVLYWRCGIIVFTGDGFHEIDLSTSFNTSSLAICEERLNPRMVDVLLENQ